MRPTAKQQQVLDVIDRHFKAKGFPPTYSEIGKELGLTKPGVWAHLKLLEKKQLVTWNPGESRTLRRVHAPRNP